MNDIYFPKLFDIEYYDEDTPQYYITHYYSFLNNVYQELFGKFFGHMKSLSSKSNGVIINITKSNNNINIPMMIGNNNVVLTLTTSLKFNFKFDVKKKYMIGYRFEYDDEITKNIIKLFSKKDDENNFVLCLEQICQPPERYIGIKLLTIFVECATTHDIITVFKYMIEIDTHMYRS